MKRVIGLILMSVLVLMVQPVQAQEWQPPQGQGYEFNPGQIRPNSLVPATIVGPLAVIGVQKDGDALVVYLSDETYIYCQSTNCMATMAAIGSAALVGGRPILLKVEGETLVGYQIN